MIRFEPPRRRSRWTAWLRYFWPSMDGPDPRRVYLEISRLSMIMINDPRMRAELEEMLDQREGQLQEEEARKKNTQSPRR